MFDSSGTSSREADVLVEVALDRGGVAVALLGVRHRGERGERTEPRGMW